MLQRFVDTRIKLGLANVKYVLAFVMNHVIFFAKKNSWYLFILYFSGRIGNESRAVDSETFDEVKTSHQAWFSKNETNARINIMNIRGDRLTDDFLCWNRLDE